MVSYVLLGGYHKVYFLPLAAENRRSRRLGDARGSGNQWLNLPSDRKNERLLFHYPNDRPTGVSKPAGKPTAFADRLS